jgi:hypothetical protein
MASGVLCALLALQDGGQAGALYACLMTGEVSSSCCCRNKEPDGCPAIEAACRCCDVTLTNATAPGTAPNAALNHSVARYMADAASTAPADSVPVAIATLPVGPDVSDSLGPPLFLVNLSFRC